MLNVFLVPDQLSPQQQSHFSAIISAHSKHFTQVVSAAQATLIFSHTRSLFRLERHLTPLQLRICPIVHTDYLLHLQSTSSSSSPHHLPSFDQFQIHFHPDSSLPPPLTSPSQVSTRSVLHPSAQKRPRTPPSHPTPKPKYYLCQSPTPLHHLSPNYPFILILQRMSLLRQLEHDSRSQLAYDQAMAAIAAYPKRIESVHECRGLPFVGEKISGFWSEIYSGERQGAGRHRQDIDRDLLRLLKPTTTTITTATGATGTLHTEELPESSSIWVSLPPELQSALHDPRIPILQSLTRIWSTSIHTALHYITTAGITSLDDLSRHIRPYSEGGQANQLGLSQHQQHWLRHAHDLCREVSREESERVLAHVRHRIHSSCHGLTQLTHRDVVRVEIVGGYRRGKPTSNDVDLLITHASIGFDMKQAQISPERFLESLICTLSAEQDGRHGEAAGGIIHVLGKSGSDRDRSRSAKRDVEHNAMAFCLFRLPDSPPTLSNSPAHQPTSPSLSPSEPTPTPGRILQLDLFICAPHLWGVAQLGYTGSKLFERSVRLYAKQERGLRVTMHGIYPVMENDEEGDETDGVTVRGECLPYLGTEELVFKALKLDYVEPEMRNC